MKINLQGQLATTAETSQVEYPITQEITIAKVIAEIAKQLPDAARDLLITPDGQPRTSLFIAIDDNHLRDTTTLIHPNKNTSELTLMPPMAGG